MNAAFRRSEAVQKLENYAPVIMEHLALVTWFPDNLANSHWEQELAAFRKTLHRVSNSKSKRPNLNQDLIVDVLMDSLEEHRDKDLFLVGLEGHGVVAPTDPDWSSLAEAARSFAVSVEL